MVSAFSKQSGAINRVLQASVFAWFLVQTKSGELTPYNIRHTVKAMAEPPGDNIQEQLCQLVETVKEDYGRVDLSAMWRPYCRYIDIVMIGLAGCPLLSSVLWCLGAIQGQVHGQLCSGLLLAVLV